MERTRRKLRESGQALVLFTVSATTLFGIMALVVDLGLLYFNKAAAQTAADAGATAGARAALDWAASSVQCSQHLSCPTASTCSATPTSPPESTFDSACLYMQSQGYVQGGKGGRQSVTVTAAIQSAPPTAPGANLSYWVTTKVTENVPTLWGRIFGSSASTVVAQSTAGIIGDPNGGCIFAMDPTAPSSMIVGGATTVNSQCGVYVNSTSNTALNFNGGGCLTASQITVVGGWLSGNCSPTPTPITSAIQLGDPFARLVAPTVGACNYTNYSTNKSATINPGVYCGGIDFGSNAVVTMNPGTYILKGGGLNTNGQSTVTANGVTFYNTFDATHSYGAVTVNGGSGLSLKAPSSGPYEGILFFEDRNAPLGYTQKFNGNSATILEGVFYFPQSQIEYTGGASTSAAKFTMLLGKTLKFTGNSKLNNDYSQLSGGAPVKQIYVVE